MGAKKGVTGVEATPVAKKVAEYFSENPKTPVVYSTKDEFLFETRKFAYDHARTLGDDEPELHNNPLAAFEPDETEDTDTDE